MKLYDPRIGRYVKSDNPFLIAINKVLDRDSYIPRTKISGMVAMVNLYEDENCRRKDCNCSLWHKGE